MHDLRPVRSSRIRLRPLRWLLGIAVLVGAVHTAPVVGAQSTPEPGGFRRVLVEDLSSGVEHRVYRGEEPSQVVHVARISAGAASRLTPMLAGDAVGGDPRLERTSSICARVHCVLAVNGDFIDAASGMPVGGTMIGGELVTTPRIPHAQLLVDRDRRASIGHRFEWSVDLEPRVSTPLAVGAVNQPPGPDGTTLYTTRWGPRTPPGDDVLDLVLRLAPQPPGQETAGEQQVVLDELRAGGGTPLSEEQVVVSGRGRGAAVLDEIWTGAQSADDRLADLTVDHDNLEWAIGGSPVLAQSGSPNPQDAPGDYTQGRHPRTAVGWTSAGEMLLVTVDGRQPGYSVGMTLRELADLLVSLGAVEAMNLDGGGSTTFVVDSRVVNRPSDPDGERAVKNALVVTVPEGGVAQPWQRTDDAACPPERVPDARFVDVDAGNAHDGPVDCLVWWQVAQGVGPATYAPQRSVSRGQMASFLARLVERTGGSLPPPGNSYPDTAGSPHEDNIRRLSAAGIVTGRADGTFGPSVPVTRAQMATMVVRTIELRTGSPLEAPADYFTDDGRSVHQASINRLAGAGIAAGDGRGRFSPALDVRRDQMASFLTRSLDHLVSTGVTGPPA